MGVLPGIGGLVPRGRRKAIIAATDSFGSSSNLTTYTATLNVGAAHPNRIVVVGFSRFGSAGTYASVKINGVEQTVITPDSSWSLAFVVALVPTGTTIAWSCTTTSTGTRHACAVWTINTGLPEFDTALATGLSGEVQVPFGGVVLGLSRQAATATYTWTGLSEDYDFSPGSSASFTAAHAAAEGGGQPWSVAPSTGSPSAIVLSLW